MSNTDTEAQDKNIYIQLFNYIYNMCVSHCKCQLYLHVKINITYINIYIYMIYMAQGTFKKPDPN